MNLDQLFVGEPVPTRRQRRERRNRRRGTLTVAAVIVAAAATGSGIALMTAPSNSSLATFPTPTTLSEPPAAELPTTASETGTPYATQEPASATPTASTSLTTPSPTDTPTDIGEQHAVRLRDVQRPAYAGSAWPALTYTLQASTGTMPAPFPTEVPGYALTASATTDATIEDTRYFAAVGKLPVRTASYDVCRQQRFYIRWMTVDPSASVQSSFVDEFVRTVQNKPVTGNTGWQSSYGCVQSAMRLAPGSGTDSTRVLIETQIWTRR